MIGSQDFATLLASIEGQGPVSPPIVQTSLFTFDSYAAFEARMAGQSDEPLYSRVQNPTVAVFEKLMAAAEGGEAAVAFASGMGAIAATLFAFLRPGDRVVCVEHVYPDAYRLMEGLLRPFGIDIAYHPVADLEDRPELMAGARLAYLESPTSAVMAPMDLTRVAYAAHRHGVLTVIDNSWATPVFQNPLAMGIDIVLHSASKYIGGHSDTVAGVVVGTARHMQALRRLTLPLLGAKLGPFEAWLLIRGLRTLVGRMGQHEAVAGLFADRLSRLPGVVRVNSPGPNSVPGLRGRSGLLSVEFDGSVDVPRLCDNLRRFRLGVSWGGFESLCLPAAVGLAQDGPHNSMRRFGVSAQLLRLSLGLENPEALWEDFDMAVKASRKA